MTNSKRAVGDLAIFGGEPAFQEALHVGRPNVGMRDALIARLDDMLDRRWLTNDGLFVRELEQRIADFVGVEHCIAFCNATLALELVLEALDLHGEVILPSFTFIATAHAVMRRRLQPVFCDIDPNTRVLSAETVSSALTPRTGAIIGVHLWDSICPTDELTAIASAHNVPLIFDAAHAFGSIHKSRRVGCFGIAEVFSFHATKFVNSFEGGAVTTRDSELAKRLRLMRNFGFANQDTVVCLGTNAKMSEIAAAMGLTSLDSMDKFIEINAINHKHYTTSLAGLPGIQLVTGKASEFRNLQYVVIEVDEALSGLTRDILLQVLQAENIYARRYFHPGCHRCEPYRSLVVQRKPLLHTERIAERVLSLPTGTAINAASIATIAGIVRLALANAAELKTRFGQKMNISQIPFA